MEEAASVIDLYERGSAKFNWWQDWRGECVAIVAAGPSTKNAGVEKLRDRIHVIVINESYQLCPWADILYSCDADWWVLRRKDTEKFAGIKMTFDDPVHAAKIQGIEKVKIPQTNNLYTNDFLFDQPGVIGSGGNSGFQMINLSAQFGVTGIGLIGFDMRENAGTHWHGLHPSPLRNPDNARMWHWRKNLDDKGPRLINEGIDVVNCSPISALTSFPKITVDQMLERWGL